MTGSMLGYNCPTGTRLEDGRLEVTATCVRAGSDGVWTHRPEGCTGDSLRSIVLNFECPLVIPSWKGH